jgi:hypothetical protein
MSTLAVSPLDREGVDHAQAIVARRHYLRKRIDSRCSVEGYRVDITAERPYLVPSLAGVLLLGRPQATACYPWYGSVEDVRTGRATCTRWEVLNLARVWLNPDVQPGGPSYHRGVIPGYEDRHGEWRSTLGSTVLRMLADRVVLDYLVRRPPCFLEEPYALRWLLSYCDTSLHRGTLYRAAGFELFRANDDGIQTWRLPLRALRPDEDAAVRQAAVRSPRSIEHRARRAQGVLFEAGA